MTLYRRLNHGKRLVFFDYLGVFKTTKGSNSQINSRFLKLFHGFRTISVTKKILEKVKKNFRKDFFPYRKSRFSNRILVGCLVEVGKKSEKNLFTRFSRFLKIFLVVFSRF